MQSTARAMVLSRPAVVGTLLVAFLLVIASGALATFSTHEIAVADQRTAHAQQTLVAVNQLLATITEAETAQRGYILTHDAKYLAPYEAALPRYREEIAMLGKLFAGESTRSGLVKRLSTLCDERFAEIAQTIQLRRDHGIAPALNVVETDQGWKVMAEIRQMLQLLQRYELAEIASHTATATQQSRLFQTLNGSLLAIAAVLAGGVTYYVIRRLHDLEGLIKICAWTKRVQWKGRWITFEEYLSERFNLNCTHGMSDEAARQVSAELANTPVPPET